MIAKDDDDNRRAWPVVCQWREGARHRSAELLEAEGHIPNPARACITKQQEVLGSQRRPVRGSRRCGDEDAGGGRQEWVAYGAALLSNTLFPA